MPLDGSKVRSLRARIDATRGLAERVADRVSDWCGSNVFLVLNVVWFVVWTVWNVGLVPGLPPFDPYPFQFLTMVVSLEAILLSIFVLIAQQRSERVDELRAEIDLQVNMITESELTKVLCIVAKLAERQGIDLSDDADLRAMLEPTNYQKLERVLDAQLGKKGILSANAKPVDAASDR